MYLEKATYVVGLQTYVHYTQMCLEKLINLF